MSVWLGVPLPAWPTQIVSGAALSSARSSAQLLKRLLAGTSTIIGTVLSRLSGNEVGQHRGLARHQRRDMERAGRGDITV